MRLVAIMTNVHICDKGEFRSKNHIMKASRDQKYSFHFPFTSVLVGGGWSKPLQPASFRPGVRDQALTLQEIALVLGNLGTGEEDLSPSGFEFRTFQSVTSRYTNYAVPPAHSCFKVFLLIIQFPKEVYHLRCKTINRNTIIKISD